MFSKVGFSISVFFLHLNQVYFIHCLEFLLKKQYPEPYKFHNRELGKFYWFYNQMVDYNEAKKICILFNQEIVQLPTQKEQIWVNKHLFGPSDCFWTGLIMSEFQSWHWKVMHGNIPNPASRWFKNLIPLLFEVKTAYAQGQYLHASNGSYPCKVVCQREYSTRQSKFGRLFGKQSLGRLIKAIPANVFQCASSCMATTNCTNLAVNKQTNMCMVFDNSINNISINCSLKNTSCFTKD